MKIRTCFVSNSSSSSTVYSECYMGIQCYSSYVQIDSDAACALGLTWDIPATAYGLSILTMRDDETVAQFRARAYDLLKQAGFTGTISDVDWVLPARTIDN